MFYFILELNQTVNARLLKIETNFIDIQSEYLMLWNEISFVKLKSVDKSNIQCIILIGLLKMDPLYVTLRVFESRSSRGDKKVEIYLQNYDIYGCPDKITPISGGNGLPMMVSGHRPLVVY